MDIDLLGNVDLTKDNPVFSATYINQCRKEGLMPAIKHLDTGEIFEGGNHRIAYAARRVKLADEGASLAESAEKGCPKRYKQGFIEIETGDFLTRDDVEKRWNFRYSEHKKRLE